jgi:SM-20-related protein
VDDSDLHLNDQEIRTLGEGGIVLSEGFIGRDEAIRTAQELGARALRPAGVSRGAQVDPDVRNDEIAWLDPEDAPALFARFESLRLLLNRTAYLGLSRMDVQLARYAGNGARYDRHLDAFAGSRRSRVITAIWYANRDWRPEHGGVLRVHGPFARDVEPILDRLVLFLSEKVEHEVLPAHAPRLAVTAWYY